MSLGIVIKSPEGIVLAAESRVTLTINGAQGQPSHFVNYDNATKLFSFCSPHNHVGVVTYGLAAIGQRTAHSFVPEFESTLPAERLNVFNLAQRISQFYMDQWRLVMPANYNGPNMTFLVAGFNEGEPYGRVYTMDLPRNTEPTEQQANNRVKSKTRARVEHVFGFMDQSMRGLFIWSVGMPRATGIIGLINLTYNIFRYEQLIRRTA